MRGDVLRRLRGVVIVVSIAVLYLFVLSRGRWP
jgi:hypothetical protein